MKLSTSKLFTILLIVSVTFSFAQQEKGIYGKDNWLYNWTEFQPNVKEYDEPTVILSGNISEDTVLKKREVYLLLGDVFVVDNATLSIEPGTVVLGDFASKGSLTITKGASIVADGLETDPIIFSSNRSVKRSGDWGGIIILGDAPTGNYGNGSLGSFYSNIDSNSYPNLNFGGEDVQSNSGILKFVRIEYAGKRNKETGYSNGLLLAAVGNLTILENIMVSHSGGDSYEAWGGDLILERAVSYKSDGNDFHFIYGTQAKLKNSLAVRSPYVSNRDGSRALVVKSYNKREEFDFTKKTTSVFATNLTLMNHSKTLKEDIERGLVMEAVYVGKDTQLNFHTSVVAGFSPAVILENTIKINQENLEKIKLTNMYFSNCNGNIFLENNKNNDDLENWYGNRAFFNVYSKGSIYETFIDIENKKRPDYRLQINRIVTSNDKEIDD